MTIRFFPPALRPKRLRAYQAIVGWGAVLGGGLFGGAHV